VLGMDYRHITDQVVNWHKPAGSEGEQGEVM